MSDGSDDSKEGRAWTPGRVVLAVAVGLGLVAVGAFAVTNLQAMGLIDAPEPDPPPVDNPDPPVVVPRPPTAAPRSGRIETPSGSWAEAVVLDLQGRTLPAAEQEIPTPGPALVRAFVDAGHETVNRAHVDLDGDGQIDERWTFKGNGQVRRSVSPEDDGTYAQTQVWSGGRWIVIEGGAR